MYPKTVIFFIAAFFAVFVTATNPVTTITVTAPAPTATTISQCNTGNISCCNTVQSASSNPIASLLGLLGIVLSDVTAQVGLGCTPISVVGVGNPICSAQAVCCTGVAFSGLINLGCNAITL